MRIYQLKDDYQEEAAKLKRKHAAPSHVDQIFDEDTTVVAPDGTTIAIFTKKVIPPKLHERASSVEDGKPSANQQGDCNSGAPSLPKTKKDGTLSTRFGVSKTVVKVLKNQGVRYGILGSLDATPDKGCHRSLLTKKLLRGNKTLIRIIDQVYADQLPETHAIQLAEVKKARRRYRLLDTAFSTAYIIKQFRSAYHRDPGNLRGVMSALIPLGKFEGGELVFPRWRVAIAFKPGDLLLFDPQQLHGNLPFKGKRLSAVFYCERNIAKCGR